jgi:hypothetical protein
VQRATSCRLFEEFRYLPWHRKSVAIDRGVDVRLIIDGKINEFTDAEGFHESFPREDNLRMIAMSGIPDTHVTLRKAKPRDIQHNKFMVLVRGGTPAEVWTGSTNISWRFMDDQCRALGRTLGQPGFVAYWG